MAMVVIMALLINMAMLSGDNIAGQPRKGVPKSMIQRKTDKYCSPEDKAINFPSRKL